MMKTIDEIRKTNLKTLIEERGSVASLSKLLDIPESTLGRISNGNIRHDRGGKPYLMGSPMARDIEAKLELEVGWMDNQHEAENTHDVEAQRKSPISIDDAVNCLASAINELGPQAHMAAIEQMAVLAKSPDSARAKQSLVQILLGGLESARERRFHA